MWTEFFNGQMGPIYFISKAFPPNVVEASSRVDSGKGSIECSLSSGSSSEGSGNGNHSGSVTDSIAADLLPHIITTDKKNIVAIPQQKFIAVYHPSRCAYGHALDIHGG